LELQLLFLHFFSIALNQKRAKETADYIKQRITRPERITAKAYGENNIVNDCECEGIIISTCSESDFQKSRRTEFSVQEKIAGTK
jgi:outer membrane protein OmpA-like peptidoglycan-associated protein